MQRNATRVFVISSVAFGVIGAVFFLTTFGPDSIESWSEAVFGLWGVSGCVVLSSFAVSVAGKYLKNDS